MEEKDSARPQDTENLSETAIRALEMFNHHIRGDQVEGSVSERKCIEIRDDSGVKILVFV